MTRLLENALLFVAVIGAVAGLLFIVGLIPVALGLEVNREKLLLTIAAFAAIMFALFVLVIRKHSRRDR